MTQDKIRRIHWWYGWILAAVMAALGVLFILSCLDIYTSGPRPYSAEAIAFQFRRISIPVLIGIIAIIGGIALNLILPLERQRTKGASSPEAIMLRLRHKANIPPVHKEIRLRRVLRGSTAAIFAALMICPLIHFLTPGNFSISKLNADVVQAVLVTLLPAALGLGLCWICRTLVNSSFRREAAVYKKALAEGYGTPATSAIKETSKNRCWKLWTIRAVIAVIALIFIIIGIFNGGAADVLKKAIAICTECIGLG